jgi:hypothetical protein
MDNLTESQKNLLRWFVKQIREGNLPEEFNVIWTPTPERFAIRELKKQVNQAPSVTQGQLNRLAENQFLSCEKSQNSVTCTLTSKAFEAVDSNFAAPDTSFIKHLTPLADITSFDKELKDRCLPILGAGNDSKHWGVAVRQAFLILEERLRSVSGIPASEKNTSEILVNKVFGDATPLITDSKERTSYRNLYSGVFTVFRNEYGHRFVDPSPEDGGAIITFVNLLLNMLEDLRPSS